MGLPVGLPGPVAPPGAGQGTAGPAQAAYLHGAFEGSAGPGHETVAGHAAGLHGAWEVPGQVADHASILDGILAELQGLGPGAGAV